jgi:hypothetical protein
MNLRALCYFIVFSSVLSFSGQAHALGFLTWDWSYNTTDPGPGPYTSSYVGSGTFTTDSTPADGYYEVTGVTGTMNGENITGLLASGTYEGSDNLLAPPPRQVTVNGVSFVTSVGTYYNIFLDFPNYEVDSQDSSSNDGFDTTGNFSAAIVPEPSEYGFFIFLAAAGFVGWRRLSRLA